LFFVTFEGSNEGLSWRGRSKDAGELAAFADFLWRFGHYYLIDRNDNMACPACSELLLAADVEETAAGLLDRGRVEQDAHLLLKSNMLAAQQLPLFRRPVAVNRTRISVENEDQSARNRSVTWALVGKDVDHQSWQNRTSMTD